MQMLNLMFGSATSKTSQIRDVVCDGKRVLRQFQWRRTKAKAFTQPLAWKVMSSTSKFLVGKK